MNNDETKVMRDTIPFPLRWIDNLSSVSDAEFRFMITAIAKYERTGEEPELNGFQLAMWKEMKNRLDADSNRYKEICLKRRENGKSGAEIRWKNSKCHFDDGKNSKCHFDDGKNSYGDGEGDGEGEEKRNCNKEKAETFSLIDDSDLKNKTDSLKDQLVSEINTLFHRRSTTEWTTKELTALDEILKRPDALQELEEIKRLYNSGYEFQRRDVKTFLNNWTTELDRSRNRKETEDYQEI